MSERTLDRIGAACGIAWFPLLFAANALVAHAAPQEGLTSENEIARILAAPPPAQAWVGEYAYALAALLFLVFTTRLWALLWRAEGGRGWLSVTVLGAGLVYVGLKFPQHAALDVLWMRAGHGLDVQTGAALWDSYQDLLLASLYSNALMTAATAVVVLRKAALPSWLGWGAVACSVLLLAGAVMHSFPFAFPFAFWVIAVGIVLFLREDPVQAPDRVVAAPAAGASSA